MTTIPPTTPPTMPPIGVDFDEWELMVGRFVEDDAEPDCDVAVPVLRPGITTIVLVPDSTVSVTVAGAIWVIDTVPPPARVTV